MEKTIARREVAAALAGLHGHPTRSVDPLAEHCGGQTLVLDSLVRTLLSQNTTDKTSIRAFKTLKERFPTWEAVLAAPDDQIENAIRVGGLAAIKTQRIKALLSTLQEERGKISLEWLRDESSEACKEFLCRFKGVGPKTISCVLMFCLHRDDFPVDTHVHHITKALGWCPANCSREQAYEHLNQLVPDEVKYDLHVLLVQHGKSCGSCSKNGKSDVTCPLAVFKNGKKRKQQLQLGGELVKEEVEADEIAPSSIKKVKGAAVVKKEEDAGHAEVKEEPDGASNGAVKKEEAA